MAELMQIGEVAVRVGLSQRTIRYWDEVGLVVPSARTAGGFRLYTESDLERLTLVKNLKPLDLTLEQMRDLMTTVDALTAALPPDGPDGRTPALLDRLAMFLAVVDSRVEVLRTQLSELYGLSHELRRLVDQHRAAAAAPQPREG